MVDFNKISEFFKNSSIPQNIWEYVFQQKVALRQEKWGIVVTETAKALEAILRNRLQNAIEQMKLFSQEDNYHYWILLFLKIDPLIDNIKDLPEIKKILSDIETKFWNYHNQIKDSLEEKGLL